uniref:Peptidase metallopeptidase domain-containing protein n=1 Tax=Varanus komodoensis TaxID=61221 RepID=A0A8D2JF66_VARKO
AKMKRFLLIVALCGALSCALPVIQETEQISKEDMMLAKVTVEGNSTPVVRSKIIPEHRILQMQQFFGLKVTGKLDKNTLDAMKKPRCGVPDIGEYNTFPSSPKWKKNDLKYRVLNYTPDMDKADVDNAIARAWKVWSDVTPLTFTRVYGESADIDISFAAGSHGDYIPFDGQGGQLAHAYSPAFGGDAHFDEDEIWTRDLKGTNLFLVAAHEFGHSLGLGHSRVWGALMFPTYQPWDPQNLRLHPDDIEGIQHLYGNNPVRQLKLRQNMCDPHLTFDAVTTLRKETVFFKDSFFWRKNPLRRDIEKTPISAFWPVLSSGIDAAYENEVDDTVFLFKGHKYWATKGSIIQPGFPKNIHHLGFPRTVQKIDAAAYDKSSKKTYFFSGNSYWRYDEAKHSMEKGYPRKITVDFHETGHKVDAAFLVNGHLYLFNGSKQYEFDSRTKQFLGETKSNRRLGCQ